MSALALKIKSEGNSGDQKKLCLVSLSSYVWNCYVMKIVIVAGNDLREFSLNVSLGLENCVVGKNGWSEEAAFFSFSLNFYNCYVIKILHRCLRWKWLQAIVSVCQLLALKILSEGNMGDHKKLRVVSLSTYVWNCCVMKILYGRLRWKWL